MAKLRPAKVFFAAPVTNFKNVLHNLVRKHYYLAYFLASNSKNKFDPRVKKAGHPWSIWTGLLKLTKHSTKSKNWNVDSN